MAFSTTKVYIGIIFALLKRDRGFAYTDKVYHFSRAFSSLRPTRDYQCVASLCMISCCSDLRDSSCNEETHSSFVSTNSDHSGFHYMARVRLRGEGEYDHPGYSRSQSIACLLARARSTGTDLFIPCAISPVGVRKEETPTGFRILLFIVVCN